jgi:hypothetical protein
MEKGWKEVLLTDLEYQAYMTRDILSEAGITAVILNKKDSVYKVFGYCAVLVPEESEKIALDLIKDLKH